MADDGKLYRERAQAERDLAADTPLPQVKDRALRSAERWDELAARAERAQLGAAERQGRQVP